jgi:hypothetical protein
VKKSKSTLRLERVFFFIANLLALPVLLALPASFLYTFFNIYLPISTAGFGWLIVWLLLMCASVEIAIMLILYYDYVFLKFYRVKQLYSIPRRSFKDNRSGIIWVWAVCFLSIIVYSIAWFSLGWGFNLFIDAIEASYTFESPTDVTVALLKTVVAWHPIIFVFGMILWALVNSQRREDVTYPRY